MNDIELANAYKELSELHGLTQAEIAKLVGKSRPAIANTLRLLELPEMIQEGVIEGKISAGHARALLMVAGNKQDKIYDRILKRGLSVREAERLAGRAASEIEEKPAAETSVDTDLEALARALEDRFHRRVRIIRDRKGGRLIFQFSGDDDLNTLLTRLSKA